LYRGEKRLKRGERNRGGVKVETRGRNEKIFRLGYNQLLGTS